jgi:predicted house-cleaning noncanonical NTP pyrophosphatase (MazG superfamily)
MSKVFYNKLIRDNIPEIITKNDGEYEVRALSDDAEFQQELFKKITEEAQALSKVRKRGDFLSEYADLMVVLDALTRQLEFTEADIRVAIEENMQKKGAFKKRLFLHWSSDKNYRSNETPQGIKKE